LGASGGFVGTFVVLANVLEEVVSDSILDGISVLTVGNKPWNVMVGWVEGFSLKGVFVLKSVTGRSFIARKDIGNVGNSSFSGAFVGNIIVSR